MLTTSVERLEESKIKLSVTVPAEQVDEAIRQAYENVGKKLRIPGFRKGHAPRPVVDNYVGKEHVLTEATEALVESTYPLALDAESLRPIDQPNIDTLDTVVAGEDYAYVAEVELRPEFTLTHTDGLAVSVVPREVTEAQVDEQVEVARERFAALEPVEDRGLEAHDYALLSFVGDVAGESYEGNKVDKFLYEWGSGQMPADFDEGLLGMKAGEDKRIEFLIPDTSSKEEFVGKTAGFDVTIHEIKAKVLPDVDDEFAVSVGGFDNVAQMREELRKSLAGPQQMQHERAKESALKAQLAERLEGEPPVAMINSKARQMMRDFAHALEERGMTVPQYCNTMGLSIQALETDINQQAEQAVKEDLALEALFRAENMEVTDEDVREEVAAMISGDETVDDVLAKWTDTGLIPVVQEEIAHRRAIQWLFDNAEITETDEGPAGDANPKGEE